MVLHWQLGHPVQWTLSVLALSSRFDGQIGSVRPRWPGYHLSVLALSSRFDGHPRPLQNRLGVQLSVLALSSRFDGHGS